MADEAMREFWDARADENALFFADNRLDYRNPDAALFWARGEPELDSVLDPLGARFEQGDDAVEIGCGVGRMTRVIVGSRAWRAGRADYLKSGRDGAHASSQRRPVLA